MEDNSTDEKARQVWRGGGGGDSSSSNADPFHYFQDFFISMLDSSKSIECDPSDDKLDKGFFMSLLEDRKSNRTTVGMVMAAIIATGNNKDYYNKVYKWIKKKPNAEPDQLVCSQFGYIMKLAEYITKTVSKSDVEYWKKLLTEAWWKPPQRQEDIWPMIFANYYSNVKQLSINGKDYVYVTDKTSRPSAQNPTQAPKQAETKNLDEDTFQEILSSNTSNKKTVGTVLEAIIAAKRNNQRYNTIIKWIGKSILTNISPALSKQFYYYCKLSDYLGTDLSDQELRYWGEILGSTEYQLPHATKDIWLSIFGTAVPNVLTLSLVGNKNAYKKNPSAMPPKKSVTPKRKVDDIFRQVNAKKFKTSDKNDNTYIENPQKRQQSEHGNTANTKKSEKTISIALIGDSSIETFPCNQTGIVECSFGCYNLEKYCKTEETINNFINTAEWKEMIKSDGDIVILSLGGDSLSALVAKQKNPRCVSDLFLQRRKEIIKHTKLTTEKIYVVGLGKKKPSDTYWRKLRTEVNQFLEQVLKEKFFIPEDLQLDCIKPNLNKTAYENLQKFIHTTYNNLKHPTSQTSGIKRIKKATKTQGNKSHVKVASNEGNFDQNQKPLAANSSNESEDLRNFLENQKQRSPLKKNFNKNVLSRLGGYVNNNQ